MFDFEKLVVYNKSKEFNSLTWKYIKSTRLDPSTKNQLRRASLSIVLNIAEGSGRFSKADRRNFFVISRGSIFECIAIFDVLKDENLMEESDYRRFYELGEELSKILFKMIQSLSSK